MEPKKILIIDDDADLVRGLSMRLKSNGYDVAAASDAISAVSEARKQHPDLVILDIGLPGGDGFVVMDRLRKLPCKAPIVVLSARDPQANRQKALEQGAKAYFLKPADNQRLMNTIRMLLDED